MISIQQEDFSLVVEYEKLKADAPKIGAIVTFTGLVRDLNDDEEVTGLFLEHYPGMTEKVLAQLIEDAKQRWPILNARIIHRVGALKASDQIVFVGVNSEHREAAFAACEFLMDFLKTKAPFWKREQRESGDTWVDAKTTDQERATRWHS
ncbi:MAG: molybdopterin synthase catalytic subunit MoaE [Pseudomonadales bacterium]|nr:molybdopterin synthase catalytic subunit MoaE [Pseudomonadales bacterium]MCP5214790.1 molybdopterin synthase catalytic subunit MoaE [Pseudomonadales bacterium]